MNQASRRAQFLRAMDSEFDLGFAFFYGNFPSGGEMVSSKVSVELEASAFGACLSTPTFVEPVQQRKLAR